jgi:putative ABC transport system ATP-binding protein
VAVLVVAGVCQGLSRGRGWVPVLRDVSFDVEWGEVVGIVGGRWSGKTTLLKVAAGIKVPERGSVRLGELELTGLSDRERAGLLGREVAWVNRVGMSLGLEVARIVGWPLALRRGRVFAERRAVEMLERVGARECAGARWGDLSPWQQVLVGFAQGFAAGPRVIVIDDLLDALGSRATEEASDLLRSLIEESEPRCGVVMSVSDFESALFADRIWSLRDGGVLEPTAGHRDTDAEVIPFPPQAQGES